MTERKSYNSVAELMADMLDESDLRDWIRLLWEEKSELRDQLAAMPRTPDGTLVVLGVTTLWNRQSDGRVFSCKPHTLLLGGDDGVSVSGPWLTNKGERISGPIRLSQCYGSESALTKGESDA